MITKSNDSGDHVILFVEDKHKKNVSGILRQLYLKECQSGGLPVHNKMIIKRYPQVLIMGAGIFAMNKDVAVYRKFLKMSALRIELKVFNVLLLCC
jgi:hypothetical protein